MSESVGSIHYDLGINHAGFDSAMAGINNKLNSIGSKMESFGNSMVSTGTQLSLAITAPLVAMGGFGIKTAAQLETAKQGFITLLGSAQKADATIARIKKEAQRTPFEIVGLTQATQMLASVTHDGDRALDFILKIGEGLAAMGRGQAELDRVSVNLQQIAAIGHASMIDIKQFAFAGIPIFEMLSEQTGLAGDALDSFISDGGITFDLLEQMFTKATSEGGRFFGAYKNQTGTLAQLMSNLKDQFAITMSDMVIKSGLFDIMKEKVLGFTNALKGLGKWFSTLSDEQKHLVVNVGLFAAALGPVLIILGQIVKTFILIKPLFTGTIAIIRFLIPPIIAVVSAIAAAVGAPVLLVVAIIAAVAAILAVIYVFRQQIWDFFTITMPKAIQVTLDWFGNIPNALGIMFTTAVSAVGSFIGSTIQWFAVLPERIAFYLGFAAGVMVKFFIIDIPNFVTSATNTLIKFFTVDIPNFINTTVGWFAQLPTRIGNALASMVNAIGAWFNNAFKVAVSITQSIVNNVGYVFTNLPKIVGNIVNNIVGFFRDLPSRIMNAIGDLAGSIGRKLEQIGKSAWEGFKKGMGIHSPSFIEKAFMSISAQGHQTVGDLNNAMDKLNSMAVDTTGTMLNNFKPQAITNGMPMGNTVSFGDVTINSKEDADYFLNRIDSNLRLQTRGVSPA